MVTRKIEECEVTFSAIRAQGAGGQNVNKVSSAVHLRFDILASSLPHEVKDRFLALKDARITQAGVLVIKSQQHRTQLKNRVEAMARLNELVQRVAFVPSVRKATQPTRASKLRRLEGKSRRADIKAGRARHITD